MGDDKGLGLAYRLSLFQLHQKELNLVILTKMMKLNLTLTHLCFTLQLGHFNKNDEVEFEMR